MKTNEALNGSLQENVLTLLCFDDGAAPTITTVVDTGLFDNAVYKRIAERATKFYRKFKKAPKEHIADVLELELSPESKQSKLYVRALRDIGGLSRTINRDFVLQQLHNFVRQQTLRRSVVEAAEFLQRDEVDEAEKALAKGFYSRAQTRGKGILLSESIGKLNEIKNEEYIFTGIDALDQYFICPSPKELLTVIGAPSRGKSWALIHMGKYAAMQRKKVLHITLEMSERKTSLRYLQSYFSASRRPIDRVSVAEFALDTKKRFTALEFRNMPKRPALEEPDAMNRMQKSATKLRGKMQVLIKEFPTDSLTGDALEAYLETISAEDSFIPDVIIVDYADLMKISAQNVRVETGKVYKDLRRIAVERNLAMITASQSNRAGEDARILTMKHFAEDYSKAGISDIILSYNQTQQEKQLGLARLFVLKARDEKSGQTVIISQAYEVGQFCMSSTHARQSLYWQSVDEVSKQKGMVRHAD